jgi:tetratricopeptide (TPR) repeat protein
MKHKEAATAYREAAKSATGDEVLNYGLNEASKMLQKCGDMAQLSQMWEEFIKQRPDHFSVVVGIYWICKAKTREGKLAEAKEITVTQLKRSLNNYKNEAVEMLLQQLAQLCWKRPRGTIPPPEPVLAAVAKTPTPALKDAVVSTTPQPAAMAAAVADVAPVLDAEGKPVPPPDEAAPPPWDAMAELEKHMVPLNAIADESGRLRLAYMRMELLKMLKRPEQADEVMSGIAKARPEVLSPQLLALSGEFMQKQKRDAEAAVFYNFLKDNFLRSAWLDYAYSGLGAMELEKGNARKAVDLYTLAVEEYAGAKVKDSTLGLAMALLESRRYPEAKKLYEQVAGTREWRGELTAQAVFYLGVVEERQGRLAEAAAYYQRVFVAYQKYATWVGKSYLKAAQCFDKLGKRKEAIAHLQEALHNDKLDPEVKSEARELLRQWGVTS